MRRRILFALREEFMRKRYSSITRHPLFWSVLILGAVGANNGVLADSRIDSHDMECIGHNDLQGRPSYEPTSYSRAIVSSSTSVTTRAVLAIP